MEEIEKASEYVIRKLEGYLKFKGISKLELAKKWKKTISYIYRRFSGEVEFSLKDILELVCILNLSDNEKIDIFFGYELRNT